MLHLFASYDYEIFLSGLHASEEKVLIEPTSKILDIYREYRLKCTLFADVCSLIRYRQLGLLKFPKLAETQLKQAVKEGHDVQLHIHPQWLVAKKQGHLWEFSDDDYRLETFVQKYPEWTLEKVFTKGTTYLSELLRSVDPQYACVAYRAGGFSVQPEKEIMQILKSKGIRIDSSVVLGSCHLGRFQHYDFRALPQKLGWHFSSSEGFDGQALSGRYDMFEIPMAGVKPGITKVILKLKGRQFPDNHMLGISAGETKQSKWQWLCDHIKRFCSETCMLSFDGWDCESMLWILKHVLKNHDIEREDLYLAILGHPKLQNQALLDQTKRFLEEIQIRYGKYVTFETMCQVFHNSK